ncbi:hypothetical protein [Rudanella lutea]|uniref:hypothetical protein n=1 Tax=Rudanella lutea TaxID=451374 RepID=UPI0003A636F2|nr:hypothetical protein [Rudanella lutea]
MRVQLLLILIGWLGAMVGAQAQLEQARRLEFAVDPNVQESFDVTTLGLKGVLVTVRKGGYYPNDPAQFRFQAYSTDLKELWSAQFKADGRFEPRLSYHDQNFLYWLFQEDNTDNIQVLRVGLNDGLVETFEGDLLNGMDIHHFKVVENLAYIGGSHSTRPVVMAFSFFDRTAKVLPGLYVNHIEISSIEVDPIRREVHVLVHSQKRGCQFSVRSYGYDTKPIRTLEFGGDEHNLISGKLLTVNDDELLLIGNYSADCTPYSQGIYVTRIRHDESGPADADRIQYIEFSALQNFFKYLKPKQQQKMQARIDRRKQENRETKFRYRLLVHDPILTHDGLLLVAEVFFPQYRGNALPYAISTPRVGPSAVDRYFDSYRYTHAIVCGFDRQGNLLWDNCLPIPDMESNELVERVQVSQVEDKLVLAYPNKGEINLEVMQGNRTIRERENFSLKVGANERQKITDSEHENLAAWYGHYFLACGFQKIVDDPRQGFNPREVFYLNKLTYSLDEKPADDKASRSGK